MQVLYFLMVFTPLHIGSFSQARVKWKQGLYCTHCSQTVMQGFQMEQSTKFTILIITRKAELFIGSDRQDIKISFGEICQAP